MKDLANYQSSEKKYRKIKKALDKEFALHDLDSISNSSSDIVDTGFEIHPLPYYIDEKETLIQHMFATIKGAKLKRMVPPSLRHMTVEELKADCLIQLIGVSKKRILCTINGKELHSSSDEESDSSVSSLDIEKEAKVLKLLQEKTSGSKKLKNKRSDSKSSGKKRKSDQSLSGGTKKKKKKKGKDSNKESDEEAEGEEGEDEKKKLIELIELEMRARAIRKLLGENDEELVIKEEPNSDDDVVEVVENSTDKIEDTTVKSNANTSNKISNKEKINEGNEKTQDKKKTTNATTNEATSTTKKPEETFKKRIRLNRTHLRSENYSLNKSKPSETIPVIKTEVNEIATKKIDNGVVPTKAIPKDKIETKKNETNILEENIDMSTEKNKMGTKEKGDKTKKKEKKKKKSKKEVHNEADDILVVEDVKKSKVPLEVIQIIESDSEEEVSEKSEVNKNEPEKSSETILEQVKQLEEESIQLGDNVDDGDAPGAAEQEKEAEDSLGWQKRWLESKGVQKIVTTSKMCTNIRKRMRFANLMKAKQQENSASSVEGEAKSTEEVETSAQEDTGAPATLSASANVVTGIKKSDEQSVPMNSESQVQAEDRVFEGSVKEFEKLQNSTKANESQNEKNEELEPGEVSD